MASPIGLKSSVLRRDIRLAGLTAAPRAARRRPSGARLACAASAEAAALLARGRQKYDAGDRMGALRLWEDALGAGATPEQRRVALFNSTAVHAGFGDVELAQITLREAVQGGLDFRAAVEDPAALDPLLVKLVASQQVLIRLRKFNEATLKKAGARAAAPPPAFAAGGGAGARAGASARAALLEKDLSKILETDMQGIDTSALGIVRRVAILLLALSGLGAALFYLGLKYFLQDVS